MNSRQTPSPARRGVATTLALAFFGLCAAALLVAGSLQLASSVRTHQVAIASQQQLVARSAGRTVSAFIEDKLSALQTALGLTDLPSAPEAERERVLEALLKEHPAFRWLGWLGEPAQVSVHAARVRQPLSEALDEHLPPAARAGESERGQRVGDVYFDAASREPLVLLAVPVLGPGGEWQGALVAEVNLKFMWELVAQLRVGETGCAYVVDRRGQLIAFEDAARVLRGESVGQLDRVREFITTSGGDSSRHVRAYRGIRGETVLGTYVELETPDWAVITELPWREAYAGVFREAVVIAAIIVITSGLAGLLGVAVARRLTVPIAELTNTAARFAAGERELRASVSGPDEVARLAEVFNHLTGQVRQGVQDLERQVAEVKHAEAALQAKSEELDCYFTNALDLLCIADTDGRFRRLNKEWQTILGYTLAELEGARFLDYVHPDDVEATLATMSRLAEQKTVLNFVNRYRSKDGSYRWIEWRSLPVGRMIYAAARDITQRKLAEEALAESEQRFRRLAEAAFEGVALTCEGVVEDCNDQMATLLGWHRKELRGREVLDWVVPDQREPVARHMARDRVEPCEHLVLRKDGTSFPVEMRIRTATVGGKPMRVIAVRDISERKRAEQVIGVRLRLLDFAAGHSLEELLQKALDEAGELTGSPVGFYHFVEADQQTLSLQAWSTRTKAEFCKAEGQGMHYPLDQAGVWTDCVRERRPVVHNDYAALPHRKGLPPGHTQLARELVVPVFRNSRVVGILGVGNKPQDYTAKDVALATFVADLAWEIAERKRAENELQTTHAGLENIGVGVLRVGTDARILGVNAAVCRSLGYTAEELCRLTVFDIDPTFTPERWQLHRQTLPVEGTRTFESVHRCKDGSSFPVEVTVSYHVIHGRVHSLSFIRDIRVQKRAQQDLQQFNLLLQTIIETAPVAIIGLDLEGRVETVWNQAAERMLGWRAEEVAGCFLPTVPPDKVEEFRQFLIQMREGKAINGVEVRRQRRDGTPVEYSVHATTLRDAGGSILGYIAVLVDVTERKRAEEALRRSEANLQLALEAARMGDWSWDVVTGEILWSLRCKALYGLAPETVVTYDLFLGCLHPEDRARVDAELRRAVEERSVYDVEKRVIWPDGSMHWNATRGQVFCNAAGEPVRVAGITLDITDRKQAERALRESEERYALAQRAANIGSWDWDILTGEIRWSEQIAPIFGLTPGTFTLSFETFARCIHPEDRDLVTRALDAAMKQEADYDIEHRIVWPDGMVRWVAEKGEILRDLEGKPTRMLGITQDITKAKLAEVALEHERMFTNAVLDSVPGLLYLYDDQGRLVRWNKQHEALTGYSAPELAQMHLLDWYRGEPEEAARIAAAIQRIPVEGHAEAEALLVTKSGRRIPFLFTAVNLRIDDRNYFVGIGIDVTERRRVEAALQENEERLRLALAGTKQGLFDLNLRTGEAVVSAEYVRMLGYEPGEAIINAAWWKDQVHPDDLEMAARTLGDCIQGRQVEYRMEYRLKTKGGDWKWILSLGRVVAADKAGWPLRMLGTHTDITERKQAEEALRRSEASLEAAQAQAHIGNWSLSLVSGTGDWSKEMYRLCARDPALGPPVLAEFLELVRPEDRVGLQVAHQHVAETGEPYRGEFRACLPGGRLRHFSTTIEVLEDRATHLPCLIGTLQDITERVQAETAVKESQERLALALQGANLGSWDWHVQTGEINVNDRWAQMLGRQREEIEPHVRAWETLVHPEDLPRVREVLQAHLEGRTPFYEAEHRMQHKSGDWVWVLDRGRVITRDAEGKPLRAAGTHLDITERKQAEAALRESEERFRHIFEHSRAILLLVDPETGTIVEANPAAAEFYGYARERLCQMVVGDVNALPREQVEAARKSAASGRAEIFVFPHRLASGEIRTVEVRSSPVNVGGRRLLFSIIQDITERKRAEAALAEHRDKLDSILRAAPTGIGVVSNRVFKEVNERICAMTGYSREELLERSSRLLYPSDEAFEWVGREKYEQITASGTGTVETRWKRKDGRIIDVLLSSTPINPADWSVGVTFTALDVTERKHAEAEREHLIDELEAKNAELERFTYTVSHDLKSPLITIKGFAGALQQDLAAGQHHRFAHDLQRISTASDKMSELLNDLLELSRIGRFMYPPVRISMDALVREALELLAGPVNERSAEIIVQPGLPEVLGDRRRLVEVYQNLIENALRFSGDQTRPRIEIGMRHEASGPVFFVRDQGVGIEPRYHETVFGLFNKLDARSPGTGIGLALARRIIEVHGGKIWVESEGKDRGATFCFTLSLETIHKERSQS